VRFKGFTHLSGILLLLAAFFWLFCGFTFHNIDYVFGNRDKKTPAKVSFNRKNLASK